MTGPERTQLGAELSREWTSRLRTAVEMMAQQQLTATLAEPDAETVAQAAGAHSLEYSFSHAAGAALRVITPAETRDGISRLVLAASGIEESDEALLKETWQEILTQAASGLAQYCGLRIGANVACGNAVDAAGPLPEGYVAGADLSIGEARFPTLFLGFPWAFLDALAIDEPAPAAAESEVPAHRERGHSLPPTLDLLLDVELPVSVSFGRTYLPVREVLKLATGSIIELDRPVNQYVEVAVNNCVIARGEVVVIEGNYGVRIHEIISRSDRLALQHLGSQNPYQQMRISA
jgi:flagellar motor switch protein FliN/FliY